MSTTDTLLRECLHHLTRHNEEYSHRTPQDLIDRIESHLRQRSRIHSITIPNDDPNSEPTNGPETPPPGLPG